MCGVLDGILGQKKELIKTEEVLIKCGLKLLGYQFLFINCNKYAILV